MLNSKKSMTGSKLAKLTGLKLWFSFENLRLKAPNANRNQDAALIHSRSFWKLSAFATNTFPKNALKLSRKCPETKTFPIRSAWG